MKAVLWYYVSGDEMKHLTLKILLLIMLAVPMNSFAFQAKGQDCIKCHTLKKEEASALLQNFVQNPKITDIKSLPVKGLWEVDVDADGKKGLLYIHFSKKYIFSGSVFDIQAKKNLTQDRLTELNKVNISQIPLGDAIVMGSRFAKNRIIVFDDPE